MLLCYSSFLWYICFIRRFSRIFLRSVLIYRFACAALCNGSGISKQVPYFLKFMPWLCYATQDLDLKVRDEAVEIRSCNWANLGLRLGWLLPHNFGPVIRIKTMTATHTFFSDAVVDYSTSIAYMISGGWQCWFLWSSYLIYENSSLTTELKL